ncbi:hypothetical protein BRD19_02375 [Halobacteriales archaeon SW_7_65_23]|nr:MAG: hypothetical protein BRD19_02375 [Halobacteriales archaeon SW_7_65_23]
MELSREDRRIIARAWEKDPGNDELEEFFRPLPVTEVVNPNASSEETERAYFREGISNLLAFLFLVVEEGNVGEFDDILETALSNAARERHRELDKFEFHVEMSGPNALRPETIAERFLEGDRDLTLSEMRLAYSKGALDRDDLEANLRDGLVDAIDTDSTEK